MIGVMIERHVTEQNYSELINHLIHLHGHALRQPGYVEGQLFFRPYEEKYYEILTITTWKSEDNWKAWKKNKKWTEIQTIVDRMLEKPVKVKVFNIFGKQEGTQDGLKSEGSADECDKGFLLTHAGISEGNLDFLRNQEQILKKRLVNIKAQLRQFDCGDIQEEVVL